MKYFKINIIGYLLILILWEVLAEYKLLPFFPTIQKTFYIFGKNFSLLSSHTLVTFLRVLSGFVIGSCLGIILALLMSWSPSIRSFMNPLILTSKHIPVMALVPIFILWFGLAEISMVGFVALGSFFSIVIVGLEAIVNVPSIYYWAGASLGASKGSLYRNVILPAIVPGLFGGLRVAAANCFPLGVAAEYMGAQKGLGFYLIKSEMHFNVPRMLSAIVCIAILSFLIDGLVKSIKMVLCPYLD